jgi:hypothetical protein
MICLLKYVIHYNTEEGLNPQPDSEWTQVVMLNDFEVVGIASSTSDWKPPNVTFPPVDPPTYNIPDEPSFIHVSRWGLDADADDIHQPVEFVECSGDLCSEPTGHVFAACVVSDRCHGLPDPLKLAPLTGPMRESQKKNPASIQNKGKRWLLYYWYATFVFGAVLRIRLPACVVARIRALYPNPFGHPYVGHQDT